MCKSSGCLIAALIWTFILSGPPIFAATNPAAPPEHLRCEYLVNPMGIDTLHPRFFWWIEQDRRGIRQSAYEILVATSPANLAEDRGDQWDSGKVASDETIQVEYAGKPLESGKTYYWKSRYWDDGNNQSPYSTVAKFSMGILSRQEWKGSWIGGGPAGGNEFRKTFPVDGKIARAQVYVTALGYYEFRINGKRIGKKLLDPAWTTYPERVLYSTYDITDELQDGANAVAVVVGGGWATLSDPAKHIEPYYKSPALLLEMKITMSDGRTVIIATDESWKTLRGPIFEDSVYDGEIYDARRETPGWDRAGFDDSQWTSASVVEGSDGIRSAEMMPAINLVDTLVPRRITNPEPGVYVFDMGQNISGWAQLKVRGPVGAKVTMRYAELLYKDGMINRENLRTAKSRDIYILRGYGLETYEPRFTYHGFRYVEVRGYPGTPSLNSLRGRLVHTAVTPIGSFLASRQILNDIQDAVVWSQKTNLFGIPTDCDQRDERQGWMADAQITAEEAMMNFDMAAFYTNFLRDMRDAQAPDGSLPPTVPHKYGPLHADPGWQSAFPIIAWYMWTHYADRQVLQENEASIKRYVDFLQHQSKDNILQAPLGPWGDWVALEYTPLNYLGDIWYYYDVDLLSRIEAVLGDAKEAEHYRYLAGQIRDAFNKTFFHADTGEYSTGTQTANAMALYMDLPSNEDRPRVVSNLTNDITYYHNTHTTSGFIGIRYLMPVLTKVGRSDLAYELAVQDSYPSWGYMLNEGATTLWELWQEKTGPSMNSQDHIMFGSVSAWFYQSLAGIGQDVGSAGYRHVQIEPQVVEDLRSASASVQTIRGPISSSWTHTPSSIMLNVSIPIGSDGQIRIPLESDFANGTVTEGGRVVWKDGHFVSGDTGVSSAKHDGQTLLFHIASGSYSFQLKEQ